MKAPMHAAGDILDGLKTLNSWIWRRDQEGTEGWVPGKILKPV